ncbi:MAG: DUF945 family protein [Anaeromyxobacter sp.]
MKKIVVAGAVVAFLALAWLSTTLYMSRSIERGLTAELDKLQEEVPGLIIEESGFERGFLSSTSTVTVRYQKAADGSPAITFRSRILNGPLPGFRTLGRAVVEPSWWCRTR